MSKRSFKIICCLIGGLIGMNHAAQAANVYIKESPGLIRFEQYTGTGGNLALWRMPNPGTSTFPGTSCTGISVPTADAGHTARFIAMYLAQKAAGEQIFYMINTTNCQIVSFGIE